MSALFATQPAAPGRTNQARVRVMVCDDSMVIRSAISAILCASNEIEVVARVPNGRAAVDALRVHDVDVVVLDIEMPVMDGLTALPLLLAASPGIAVIMASTLTTRGAETSMRALRLGAADTMPKPSALTLAQDQNFAPELVAKVLGLARLRRARASGSARPAEIAVAGLQLRPQPTAAPLLLAIGSSTGGPNALFELVRSLRPGLGVPVVITQHMPPAFTRFLAEHIDKLGVLPCAEAQDGEPILPGRILLAPGGLHLLVRRRAGQLCVKLSNGPAENFCRPSVDAMLRSASEAMDGRVLVAMLTGMGQDGLAGAKQVVQDGGSVVAQDEATSVVWGMPGAVARAGLACAILPLPQLGARLQAMLGGQGRGARA